MAEAETEPKNPQTFYSQHGDCLEIFFDSDPYVGKRIDGLVTVYVSEKTGKPVGVLMKGMRAFLSQFKDRMPNASVDFGTRFSLEYLITAYIWSRNASDGELNLVIAVRDKVRQENLEFGEELIAG